MLWATFWFCRPALPWPRRTGQWGLNGRWCGASEGTTGAPSVPWRTSCPQTCLAPAREMGGCHSAKQPAQTEWESGVQQSNLHKQTEWEADVQQSNLHKQNGRLVFSKATGTNEQNGRLVFSKATCTEWESGVQQSNLHKQNGRLVFSKATCTNKHCSTLHSLKWSIDWWSLT